MTIPVHDGLSAVIGGYRAVICDLWGAVHDGVKPYPGAVECLHTLRREGRGVVLLSNAPRPSPQIAAFLRSIGVPDDAYDHLITSGDATVEALARRDDDWHRRLGHRYFHLGPARTESLLREIADREVPFEDAEYILNTGLVDDESESVEDYRGLLEEAAARGLPMICVNPDIVVMRGPRMVPCAGALAALYEQLGGDVRRHGKPYESVFEASLARLGGPARSQVLVIGDGLSTDIAGAARAGMDSVWIAGGIHAEDVGLDIGRELDPAHVTAYCERTGQRPMAAVPALVW